MNQIHNQQEKNTAVLKTNILFLLIQELRPKQWSKNLLLFAALIFSVNKVDGYMILKSIIAFFLFSLISGCVYILNDYIDIESDRNHPEKIKRPMASGMLNPKLALAFSLILLIITFTISHYISIPFFIVVVIYWVVNILYTLKLKHVVMLDIMIIAICFVLRAIAGGIVIGVQLTSWFLVCTFLLALFLSISKRRHELFLLQEYTRNHRKVLESYSPELINQILSISTTATIVTYALFTFTSGHSVYMMFTLPFVLYGIFRYLYLIYMKNKGGSPEKLLIEDKHIFVTVLLYTASVLTILKIWG